MADTETIKSVADLTMIFDPRIQWPKPESCPDWPLTNAPQENLVGGAGDARNRLALLDRQLNKGQHAHEPDDGEALAIKARYFKAGNHSWRWQALGFNGIRPSTTEPTADMIIEAVHLRGYLRKLEARDARLALEKVANERTRHRNTIASYQSASAAYTKELAEISEAVARHKQRLADEQADLRDFDLRRSLREIRYQAEAAARALGEELPDPVVVAGA